MLSKREKGELLNLAQSKKLRTEFRKLSSFNQEMDGGRYMEFLTSYSQIFDETTLIKGK